MVPFVSSDLINKKNAKIGKRIFVKLIIVLVITSKCPAYKWTVQFYLCCGVL